MGAAADFDGHGGMLAAAGLAGIEKGYTLPEPVEQDIFHMDGPARSKLGITALPATLSEACDITEKSALVRETLGDHIFGKLLANKRMEWDKFRMHVTDYELNEYLPLL